ncbi:glycosyltransferase [Pseudoalteromonas sp. A757]|uniref:glycosyltransferase n=1 Tax=Pseudoalteromonas sp. A757 TaxID=2250709 RepID=UPI000FFEB545|nr:glycosyltransferase [Pseudoalteromonas sp. A757]RXE85350.1 hypothetical protein DRB05_16510 [Pseudoalteromonas sp. A757]
MKISLIVPTYNSAEYIQACLASLVTQLEDFAEIIVIDDCSTDDTFALLSAFAKRNQAVHVLQTETNSGPGVARNLGIEHAKGEWILFVDSDDALTDLALKQLIQFVDFEAVNCDVVAFDWRYKKDKVNNETFHFEGRFDKPEFTNEKALLLEKYVKFRMDHSAIYLMIKRQLLIEHQVSFAGGFHEDIDFTFLVYWHAREVKLLDEVIYLKTPRPGSIVNSVSMSHIKGFYRSYAVIHTLLKSVSKNQSLHTAFLTGVIGLVATCIRKIFLKAPSKELREPLYEYTFKQLNDFSVPIDSLPLDKTYYSLLVKHFLNTMMTHETAAQPRSEVIDEFLEENEGKKWSCIDLHHSAFLAPKEIRTCCKRFFVDNEMRGDVTIVNSEQLEQSENLVKTIMDAKKKLFADINMGEPTGCDGCPYLEFKQWGAIESSKITKVSYEHHSVCNLKCSYCSDTYYGGEKPAYDVLALQKALLDEQRLSEKALCIWGGGEPTSDKHFSKLLLQTTERLPLSSNRVITNAVVFNKAIYELLLAKKVSIFTSIDAGTEETFVKIRGKNSLHKVMENLVKYSSANAEAVTVKYIFTDGNKFQAEIRAFAELIARYQLKACNFQISFDFKEERISSDDLVLIVRLYKSLKQLGAHVVYLDDLILMRIGELSVDEEALLADKLELAGLNDIVALADSKVPVALWGAGETARLLLEHSNYFKRVELAYFVDPDPNKIGTTFMGKPVYAPDVLTKTHTPVFIAAVQYYAPIYREFKQLGLPDSRLINKLII